MSEGRYSQETSALLKLATTYEYSMKFKSSNSNTVCNVVIFIKLGLFLQNQAQCHTPVILATWDTEARGS